MIITYIIEKTCLKSLFKIYADFKSILVPEDNEKQNPGNS